MVEASASSFSGRFHMRAIALGFYDPEKEHILADDEVDFDPQNDGSVFLTFKTNEIELSRSNYRVRVHLTAEEIDALYRRSMAGSAKGAVQGL
jgi:hypothetical protein